MKITTALLATILLCGTAATAAPLGKSPKGYYISIDSLRGEYEHVLSEAGVLTAPRGIKWLHDNSYRAEKAWPVDISITAPSHVSNITCSHPRTHGIFGNSFLRGGQKVNGFSADIQAETMWESAKRQGKKVLSVAWVGADGKTDKRRSDVGISYPSDSLVGKGEALLWEVATLPDAQGWIAPEFAGAASLKEASISLVINNQTTENRSVNALFVEKDGRKILVLDDDKDVANGVIGTMDLNGARLQTVDLFVTETSVASPIVGYKKRIRFTYLGSSAGKVSVQASPASYNNAWPTEFRQALDNQNLVWVDPYISAPGANLNPSEYVKVTSAQDDFMADVAVFAQTMYDFDVVLFYQPRLDEFSHKFEGEMSSPLNPVGANPAERAFVEAFQTVDRNVSKVLGNFVQGSDVVALMGDHGMEKIKTQINIGPFIREVDPTVGIVVTGALVMLYSTTGDIDQRVGENIQQKLAALTFAGNSVGGTVFRKDQTPADQWMYGEATWAFTSGPGMWYTNSTSEETFLTPPITGMHGHYSVEVPQMGTTYMLHGPNVTPQVVPEFSLLNALPTFLAQLGIVPPANCEGVAISVRKVK